MCRGVWPPCRSRYCEITLCLNLAFMSFSFTSPHFPGRIWYRLPTIACLPNVFSKIQASFFFLLLFFLPTLRIRRSSRSFIQQFCLCIDHHKNSLLFCFHRKTNTKRRGYIWGCWSFDPRFYLHATIQFSGKSIPSFLFSLWHL